MNNILSLRNNMKIVFSKTYLADLYEGNVRDYKEYKSNPQLVKQYVKTIDKLKGITDVQQLYQLKSLHYSKKTGDLAGVSAVWVNEKYRILFREIASEEDSLTIDILKIADLSKHYE